MIRDEGLVEWSKGKGKDDQEKEKHSLDNIYDHLAEGHIERIKVDWYQVSHLFDRSSLSGI